MKSATFSGQMWPKTRDGVTLLELLIGIAIVAVMVVLAFPAVSEVRKRSGTAKCVQNLRQIGAGLQLYMVDHGSFPYMNTGTTRWYDGSAVKASFFAGPYLGAVAQWQRYAKQGEPTAKGGIFDCPVIGPQDKEGLGPDDWVSDHFDYAINITLCGRVPAEISRPARTVMVAEGGNQNRVKAEYTHGKVYNKGNTTPISPGGTAWNWHVKKDGPSPVIYSKGRNHANFLFFDGHVGLHAFEELGEDWFDAS